MTVLETTVDVMRLAKPALIIRGAKALIRGIKSAFGQLATTKFWMDLGGLVVQTMINAFILTIGGRFVSYGRSRQTADTAQSASTPASSAFSQQGYAPRTEFGPRVDYNPRTDYRNYAPSQPTSAQGGMSPFPGF